jgi:hypothetical protein
MSRAERCGYRVSHDCGAVTVGNETPLRPGPAPSSAMTTSSMTSRSDQRDHARLRADASPSPGRGHSGSDLRLGGDKYRVGHAVVDVGGHFVRTDRGACPEHRVACSAVSAPLSGAVFRASPPARLGGQHADRQDGTDHQEVVAEDRLQPHTFSPASPNRTLHGRPTHGYHPVRRTMIRPNGQRRAGELDLRCRSSAANPPYMCSATLPGTACSVAVANDLTTN